MAQSYALQKSIHMPGVSILRLPAITRDNSLCNPLLVPSLPRVAAMQHLPHQFVIDRCAPDALRSALLADAVCCAMPGARCEG